MRYDNDGKPCFQSHCGKFYFYFRAIGQVWVIDDVIQESGTSYTCSSTADFESPWLSSPSWAKTRLISATIKNDTASGHRGQVLIQGCAKLHAGCSVSASEDGIYHRQPACDNINGQAHYVKMIPGFGAKGGQRRHLFFSSSGKWQISPVCNEEQGLFTQTCTSQLEGSEWEYLPPDIKESNVWITMDEKSNFSNLTNSAVEEDGEEQNLLNLRLLRWGDSNHECVLFSNVTHTVTFLSMNPTTMRKGMHPTLLKHLDQNKIEVGENMMSVNDVSYWKILCALTGVNRSKDESEKVSYLV